MDTRPLFSDIEAPLPEPALPAAYSVPWLCLHDLIHGELNQPHWVDTRKNWKLSTAISILMRLGWPIKSVMDYCPGRAHKVSWYSLNSEAVAIAKRKLGGQA